PVRFNGDHTIYQNDVTRQCRFNIIVNILPSVDLHETNLLWINLVDEAPKAGLRRSIAERQLTVMLFQYTVQLCSEELCRHFSCQWFHITQS
ncbi:hypothetical protein P7L96_24435, partial [Vibrio parahaemolyticus]|nr:hypothetical protein [Vibrio parahaemolyticus]